ncbi:hypothetical protein E4U40_004864 [Claviceps sp. LM458 group G5]|nr:hypothetical protein E4U40_004864 [Claviceps sp. LM458 group G5]
MHLESTSLRLRLESSKSSRTGEIHRAMASQVGMVKRGLKVEEYELRKHSFCETSSFDFGVSEHIDLGIK